jgi:hypothetical protein
MKRLTPVLPVNEIEPVLGFWEAVEALPGDVERIHPRRKTFYVADEISVREPGGNAVTFAEFEHTGG